MECQFNVSFVFEGKKNSRNGGDSEVIFLIFLNVVKFSIFLIIFRKKKRIRVGQFVGSEFGDGLFSEVGNVVFKYILVKILLFFFFQV